jgi:hypothetical protein
MRCCADSLAGRPALLIMSPVERAVMSSTGPNLLHSSSCSSCCSKTERGKQLAVQRKIERFKCSAALSRRGMLAFVEEDGDGIAAATILSVTVVSPCHDGKTPQSEKWSHMIALHEVMETLHESCSVFPNLRKLAKLGMKLICSRTRCETGAQLYGNVYYVSSKFTEEVCLTVLAPSGFFKWQRGCRRQLYTQMCEEQVIVLLRMLPFNSVSDSNLSRSGWIAERLDRQLSEGHLSGSLTAPIRIQFRA